MTLLKAHEIKKIWNQKGLLSPVSQDFQRGHSYRLCADNGKGKTTFLKICAGLITPSAGKISCLSSRSWCSSHGCGEVPRLTGHENIEFMAKFFKNKNEKLHMWRELGSFNDALETEYGKCSDGMKMLISLYISTLSGAKILLWDEPFAHLSYENSQKILKSWEQLTGAETLIFSSHDEIEDFSGEVIFI